MLGYKNVCIQHILLLQIEKVISRYAREKIFYFLIKVKKNFNFNSSE